MNKRKNNKKEIIDKINKNITEIGVLLAGNSFYRNYTTLRLARDLKEIKFQKIPIEGVSAFPINEDLMKWHANLKNIADNIYKGIILHLEIKFPSNYPKNPPNIIVKNPGIKHKSITPSGNICLEMLDTNNSTSPCYGWNCAYSVLSILTQLQNFFFDVDYGKINEDQEKEAKEVIAKANEYSCSCCPHEGSSNPYPEFIKLSNNKSKESQFLTTKDSYRESQKEQIKCVIRKVSYEESPLGYGLDIVRLPRTGEIKNIKIVSEYISLKSFIKQNIRCINNKVFKRWLPLYFGINKEQIIELSTRALSIICTGSKKNFNSNQVIEIYPKILTTLVNEIINEKCYMCCKSLKTLIHVYRVFKLMLNTFPEMQEKIDNIIDKFINSATFRLKDNTSSLGDFLAYATVGSKHKFKEIIPFYIDESLDRSIFWSIKLVPDLEYIISNGNIDELTLKACFKAGNSGFLQFYYYFNKHILRNESINQNDFCKRLDEDFGNLNEDQIYNHLIQLKEIFKIDNYLNLYEYLEQDKISNYDMSINLKQAYNNSLAKKYHGDIDEVRFVPDEKEQIKIQLNKYEPLQNLIDKETKKLINADNTIWKELCLKHLEVVKKLKYKHPNKIFLPYELGLEHQKLILNETYFNSSEETFKIDNFMNNIICKKDNKFKEVFMKPEYEFIKKHISWKNLYIKVYFEFYIRNFKYIADFKQLYEILELVKENIYHLDLFISKNNTLKSDYNYIRVLLSKLVKVKYLRIIFEGNEVSEKILKNINKGYALFSNSKGETEFFSIICNTNTNIHSNTEFNLLSLLDKMKNLKHLRLKSTILDKFSCLKIRNHLYYFKSLQSLDLSYIYINETSTKELSDGIMKAKNLELLDLSNSTLEKGLSSILYNLAFQPMIKYLDISNCKKNDPKELSNSLYKLIKMSLSLEVVYASNINNLNTNFPDDFYISLGDNSSLRVLDLSSSGIFDNNSLSKLGNAVSFNALKKGELIELSISNTISFYNTFCIFIDGMHISEEDHYKWYGSLYSPDITKENKLYYEKKFYCGLNYLDISGCSFETTICINDLKNTKENHFRKFLENNNQLSAINLRNSRHNKNSIELIVNALSFNNSITNLNLSNSNLSGENIKLFMSSFGFDNQINYNCKIENLNLSRNNFGYLGAKGVSDVLKFNKTIKALDLYNNIFDVDGARRISESLMNNQTLEYLNIGYNRIKDVGLEEFTKALKINKKNKLKYLNIKYNFIKNNSLIKLFEEICKKESNLKFIEANNNLFDEKTIKYIYLKYLSNRNPISDNKIDLNDYSNNNLIFNSNYNTSDFCVIENDFTQILYYTLPYKLQRTVWISSVKYNISKYDIYSEILKAENNLKNNKNSTEKRIGIPYSIIVKRGRLVGKQKDTKSSIAFIEFIHENSTNMLLKIASKDGIFINNSRVKIYKAGTKPEYVSTKKKIYKLKSIRNNNLSRGRAVKRMLNQRRNVRKHKKS